MIADAIFTCFWLVTNGRGLDGGGGGGGGQNEKQKQMGQRS